MLARELAHLRLSAFAELPGSRQDMGATGLAAVVTRFGLFGANCPFNFQRFQAPISQGWKLGRKSSRLGCLEEREWGFALAVLFDPTERDADAARDSPKPYLSSDLRAAVKSLRRRRVLPAGIEGSIG